MMEGSLALKVLMPRVKIGKKTPFQMRSDRYGPFNFESKNSSPEAEGDPIK